jgi:hypothetical protein
MKTNRLFKDNGGFKDRKEVKATIAENGSCFIDFMLSYKTPNHFF